MPLRPALDRALNSVPLLVVAFVAVHLVLGWIDLTDSTLSMFFDVTVVYRDWIDQWVRDGQLVGVDVPWVYPLLALVPMLLSEALGRDLYGLTWLLLVGLMNGAAMVVLARRSRRVAWWWLAFTALLGPIALGRIDAVALALAIPAVVVAATRPAVAGVLLTIGTWIKIWPAALVLALLAAGRRPLRVLVAAAAVSAAVIGGALALGAGGNVLSVLSMQTGRGMQIEAPASLPWMWLAHFSPGAAATYFDYGILTWQVAGPGSDTAAALMNPVLGLAVLGILVLAVVARRRSAHLPTVLAAASTGLVTALILFNKVGSPQYGCWLAAPIVLGLLTDPRQYRVPAVLTLAVAGATQVVYPWAYGEVITTHVPMLLLLTVRAVLEVGLMGIAVRTLVGAGRTAPAMGRTSAITFSARSFVRPRRAAVD